MYCNQCPKRDQCIEICPELKIHLKNDIEVSRREALECELGINIDEVVEKTEWPEGLPELNTNDWVYFVGKYKMKRQKKRYIFLRYWKYLSFRLIGKKCRVSWQTVEQTIKRFKEKNKMSKIQTIEEYLKEGGEVIQCPPDTKTKKEDMNESNLRVKYCDTLYQGIRTRNEKKFHPNEKDGYVTKKGKYRMYRSVSPFDITKKWIMDKLLKGSCEKSGINFDYSSPKKGSFTNPFIPSIDRIDSSKEYSKSNCQMVVWIYNRAKGDGTDGDVLYLAENLVEYINKSSENTK